MLRIAATLLLLGAAVSARAQETISADPIVAKDDGAPEREGPPRLAVTDTLIKGGDLDPAVGQSISAVIASETAQRAGDIYDIISRNEVRAVLDQVTHQQMMGGCTDCETDITKLMPAEFILSSSINRVGDEWVFTLELTEVAASQVRQRQTARYKGDAGGLVELVRPYVTRLFDAAAENYRGSLDVLVTEKEADVYVNEKQLGASPVSRAGDLPIGTHRVTVKKDGFLPFEGDVVINNSETSVLTVSLIDEDSLRPWYRKWWVWSAAGAVAVAVTTTAILLTRDDGSNPQGAIILRDHPVP